MCHSIPAIYSDVSKTIGSMSILTTSPPQYQEENSLSSFVRSSCHNLFGTLFNKTLALLALNLDLLNDGQSGDNGHSSSWGVFKTSDHL